MLWKDLSKKEKIIIYLCCIILLIVGMMMGAIIESAVHYNQQKATIDKTGIPERITPSMTYFGEDNRGWHYYADDRTNVLYIVYDGSYQYGITPAYNTDGTLMTRDQLNKGDV